MTNTAKILFVLWLAVVLLVASCSVPPVRQVPTEAQGVVYLPPTLIVPPTATPTRIVAATVEAGTPEAECTLLLSYVADLTIPDGTLVDPGSEVDKQWEIENSGTCPWDRLFTFRIVDGETLGVDTRQPLPSLSPGETATLQILFTAPDEPGNYRTTWQAFDPDNHPFGDQLYMEIIVDE
jgi:hypothetical protein